MNRKQCQELINQATILVAESVLLQARAKAEKDYKEFKKLIDKSHILIEEANALLDCAELMLIRK